MTTSQAFDKICSYQSNQFKEWFGDMPFEESSVKLYWHELPRRMNDAEIMDEMNPGEVSIGEMYNCLESLDHNVLGIFYVKDTAGVLRTVSVGWYGVGWGVVADSVESPFRWDDGDRVFSRNKTLIPSDNLTLEAAIELCQKNGLIVSKPLN